MIVAARVAGGRRAALGALFAILAADVILIALVASGLGVLTALGGATLDWLTTIGGLVLVMLGLRMFRDDRKGVPSRVSAPAHSLGSFIATITNPKSLLFFAAFLPQFVGQSMQVTTQLVVLSAVFLVTVGIGDSLWVAFAGSARKWFSKFGRLRNRVTGGFLIGAGVGLALARRSM